MRQPDAAGAVDDADVRRAGSCRAGPARGGCSRFRPRGPFGGRRRTRQSLVSPDLLDDRVVEVGLQRPEPRHRVEHQPRGQQPVAEHRQVLDQRALLVVAQHLLDQQAHQRRFGRGVHPPAPHLLADLGLDQGGRQRGARLEHRKTR